MTKKEINTAKSASLLGAMFIITSLVLQTLGGWDNNFYEETSLVLHYLIRILLGIFLIGLTIHFLMMLYHMLSNRKWFWLLASFIGVFITSFIYYIFKYPKNYE